VAWPKSSLIVKSQVGFEPAPFLVWAGPAVRVVGGQGSAGIGPELGVTKSAGAWVEVVTDAAHSLVVMGRRLARPRPALGAGLQLNVRRAGHVVEFGVRRKRQARRHGQGHALHAAQR